MAHSLGKRLGEHQKQGTSAVKERQSKADWEGVKIIDQENVDVSIRKKLKEAVYIRQQPPAQDSENALCVQELLRATDK